MKRGFTLIELLAVIVLLAITAVIATSVITKIIDESKLDAFKDSVYVAINSYANKEANNKFVEIGEVDVRELVLENTAGLKGTVKRNDNNEVVAVNITNGIYCANGPKKKLVVIEGTCE